MDFIKVAAVTPDIRVADCEYNAEQICKKMKEAAALGSKIIVFPELCITGYTCEDLFWQEVLLNGAKDALDQIRKESREIDALVFVGLPWEGKESFTMLQRRSPWQTAGTGAEKESSELF